MQYVITSDNFSQVLSEIKNSADSIFDFSNSDFRRLQARQIDELFSALRYLPQSFTLKLNNCKLNENSEQQILTFRLGFSTTQNMHGLEFKRSISPECPEIILLLFAKSITRNHALKTIAIDGYRVTPAAVSEELKRHPTAKSVVVDGLLKVVEGTPTASYSARLFQSAPARRPAASSEPTPTPRANLNKKQGG